MEVVKIIGTIDIRDKIRHNTDNKYNDLQLEVKDAEREEALCRYLDHKDKAEKNNGLMRMS